MIRLVQESGETIPFSTQNSLCSLCIQSKHRWSERVLGESEEKRNLETLGLGSPTHTHFLPWHVQDVRNKYSPLGGWRHFYFLHIIFNLNCAAVRSWRDECGEPRRICMGIIDDWLIELIRNMTLKANCGMHPTKVDTVQMKVTSQG